jgi:hypothetical protein
VRAPAQVREATRFARGGRRRVPAWPGDSGRYRPRNAGEQAWPSRARQLATARHPMAEMSARSPSVERSSAVARWATVGPLARSVHRWGSTIGRRRPPSRPLQGLPTRWPS